MAKILVPFLADAVEEVSVFEDLLKAAKKALNLDQPQPKARILFYTAKVSAGAWSCCPGAGLLSQMYGCHRSISATQPDIYALAYNAMLVQHVKQGSLVYTETILRKALDRGVFLSDDVLEGVRDLYPRNSAMRDAVEDEIRRTVAASKKEKKELVASGALAISESPSVWPGVRELAVSSLPEWDGDSNESSKTAVALRRVLESVSREAVKVLGIEERRGVVSKDAFADFMLVKLNPEWELSTVDSIAAADVQTSRFNTIPEAIEAMKRGDFVIVVDNEDRENEGDFIIAAEDVTEEKMAFMIRYSGGVVCVPMEGSRLDALKLPLMVTNNEDSLKTAYTISVDYKHGTTTGISSHDRAMTLRQLANPTSQPTDFTRPGHVFPLRAHENGVLSRVGHTEASLDLCRLAGKQPCAGISEVVLDEGGMARRDDLLEMGRKWGLCVVTIDALVKYRVENGV
ncbi:hypothetical protein HDU99_004686 [Rhizoclosmatium hyalinum]|nr:hypothetical protein HDU99_004686 [Rhizoclosmatium hyalinum]